MQNISRFRALRNYSSLVSYQRYPKTRYLDESSVEDLTLEWPTFVDMTGFQNADDEDVKKNLGFRNKWMYQGRNQIEYFITEPKVQ